MTPTYATVAAAGRRFELAGPRNRYHIALGSAREVLAVLEVADALGYFKLDESLVRQLNRIIGTLVKIVRG